MPKNKKEAVSYGYDSYPSDELKDTVIRLLKEKNALKAEKKDYVKSISESLKEIDQRLDDIVYWLGVKETQAAKERLVEDSQKAVDSAEG